MRCANNADTDAAARMHVAGEEASQDSAAGDRSLAAADKQPATPEVAGARRHPRAASSSAASAAGGRAMDDDPEIEVPYSGESDSRFDSKSFTKPSREAENVESTTAQKRGSIDPELHRKLFGSSDESMKSSPGSSRPTRIRLMRVKSRTMQFVLMMSTNPREVIVVVANLVIAATEVFTEPLRKRIRIVMRYDLLLRTGHGYLP